MVDIGSLAAGNLSQTCSEDPSSRAVPYQQEHSGFYLSQPSPVKGCSDALANIV